MKKILTVLLAGCILLGMTACGENLSFGRFEYSEVNSIPTLAASVDTVENVKRSSSEGQILTDVSEQGNVYQNPILSPARGEGEHYYIGYYVALMNSNGESYVALYKQNYGETELARFNMDIPLDRPVTVMVEAVNEDILVYVDGQCVIEYSDPDPYLKGAVGFANIISAKVSDLKAEPLFS